MYHSKRKKAVHSLNVYWVAICHQQSSIQELDILPASDWALRHVLVSVSREISDHVTEGHDNTSFHWVPPPPYPFVFTLLLFSASCIAKCLITPDFTRTERRQWIASRTMPRQGNITKIVKQHNDRLPGQRREAFIEGVPIFVQNLIAAPARLLLNVGEYRCPHGINFFTPFMNYLTTPFFTS